MIDKSGSAFPSSNSPDTGYYAEGMTLRDYFAAKAMQALIPMGHEELEEFCGNYDGVTTIELLAESAYRVAYQMLQRRDYIDKATGKQS